MKEWDYSYDPNEINHIVEEKENSFIAIRKIKWSKDSDTYKLDIRKYRSSETGDIPSKGVSFYNEEEATTEIINGLLQNGYGDSTEISKCIFTERPEIAENLIKLQNGEMTIEELDTGALDEFYDPREMLG